MKSSGKTITVVASCMAAVFAVSGCGGGTKDTDVDVAALNAELAVMEGALTEQLDGLVPEKVEQARSSISVWVTAGEKTVAELPPDDCDEMSALAIVLGRFRTGCESPVAEAVDAANASSAARLKCQNELASLRKTAADLARKDTQVFIDSFATNSRSKEVLLSGWRRQRLEKMENQEIATFPVFAEAEADQLAEWKLWSANAAATQKTILDVLLPQARDAASNLIARAADAVDARDRVVGAIARIRAIPVDAKLVDSARNEALDAFDVLLSPEIAAVLEWDDNELAFPDDAVKSANALESQVKAFSEDADVFLRSHGDYVAEKHKTEKQQAVNSARAVAASARESAACFSEEMVALRKEGDELTDVIVAARQAEREIRSATILDEERLVAQLAAIETLRSKIVAPSARLTAAARRKGINDLRKSTLEWFREAETNLTSAVNRFAAVKAQALSDEWDAEKRRVRESLAKITADLKTAPSPGLVRPEREAMTLQETVNGLLVRLDSMGKEELWAAVEKAHADLKEIEAKTKWTPGTRHPDKPHIFAAIEDGKNVWDADPGYWFDHPGENSDLVVSWRPGLRHPGHPHISAGQTEGTWVSDPGYKERWKGDLDPVWTKGVRHPTKPHIFADFENGKEIWNSDPGYRFNVYGANSDLSVHWESGCRHPTYEGIESAQQEGRWNTLPGWAFIFPGTSDLRTRWVPDARYPGKPHIHASDTKWKWSADDGYDFDEYNSSNLSVHWVPGARHSLYRGIVAAQQEGLWNTKDGWSFVNPGTSDLRAKWNPGTRKSGWPHVFASGDENVWTPDAGYTWADPDKNDDFSVKWTPGWISPDGQRRAKEREGRFETKYDCASCENGWKEKWSRCGTCNGSGKFLFGNCPGCNGVGKTLVSRTICKSCDGTGWKWR